MILLFKTLRKGEALIRAKYQPAQKVFEYQLELADQTILLSTALLSGAIALAGLFSALKEK